MLLTKRGWTVLALAGFAAYAAARTGQPVLTGLMTLTLAALFISVVSLWRLAGGLEIEREIPAQVFAGDILPVKLNLANAGTAKSLFFITDFLLDKESENSFSIAIDLIKAGERRTVSYEMPAARRGVLKFQRIAAESRAPFGLLSWRRERILGGSTIVLPYPGRVWDWECPGGRRHSGIGVESLDRSGATNEYFAVRDYYPGDPIRHIHWKQTARTRQLKVREFQTTSSLEVEVLPNLSKEDYSLQESAVLLEAEISLTASLCAELIRRGYFVRLWTLARRVSATLLESGPAHLRSILEGLAGMEANRDESYKRTLGAMQAHFAPRSAVICVSPLGTLAELASSAAAMTAGGFAPQMMLMEPARKVAPGSAASAEPVESQKAEALGYSGARAFRFLADEDFRSIRMPSHEIRVPGKREAGS